MGSFEELMMQQAFLHEEIRRVHEEDMMEVEEEVRKLKAHLNLALVSKRNDSHDGFSKSRSKSSELDKIERRISKDSHSSSSSQKMLTMRKLPSTVVVPTGLVIPDDAMMDIPGEVHRHRDSCDSQDIEILQSHLASTGNSSEADVPVDLSEQPSPPKTRPTKDPAPPPSSPAPGFPHVPKVRQSLALPGLSREPVRRRSLTTPQRPSISGAVALLEQAEGRQRSASFSLVSPAGGSRRTSRVITTPAMMNGIVPNGQHADFDVYEPWPVWYDVCELAPIDGGNDVKNKTPQAHQERITRLEQMRKMAKSRDFHTYEALRSPLFSALQSVVLHPSSPKRLGWVIFGMVLITYDLIMLPMSAFDLPLDALTVVMTWFIALFWTLDTVGNFFVGYYVKSTLEMRLRKTVEHYTKTWFAVDFFLVIIDFSVIVSDTLSSNSGRSEASSLRFAKSVKTMRTLRSIRLLRVVKLPHIFKDITGAMSRSEYASLCLGIVKHLSSILMVNHLIACLWYLIGKEHKSGWVSYYMSPDDNWDLLYLMSLHWSLTQFTPASMAVQPQTLGERLFAVTVIVFALITFSSFVSSITNLMTHLRSLKSVEAKQFARLERYMSDNHISFHLSLRVRRFLEHSISQTKRRPQEKDVELIQKLSEPLRQELHYEVHSPVLSRHPFFANYSMLNLPAMQKLCHTSIITLSLSTDDMLFNSGETASRIYFVTSGSLEYVRSKGKQEFLTAVEDGQWVSEMVLWTPWEHRGVMKAQTESTLQAVGAYDFHNVVLQSKVAQLEASAFAFAAVKILNENFTHSDHTDLNDSIYDPHAISLQVFKSDNGHHKHWLRSANPLRQSDTKDFRARGSDASSCRSSRRASGSSVVASHSIIDLRRKSKESGAPKLQPPTSTPDKAVKIQTAEKTTSDSDSDV